MIRYGGFCRRNLVSEGPAAVLVVLTEMRRDPGVKACGDIGMQVMTLLFSTFEISVRGFLNFARAEFFASVIINVHG